jgi:putative heme transporter
MAELPDQSEITAEGIDALKVPAELVEHELAAKPRGRRILEIVVSIAVVVVIFVFAIPAITNSDYADIFDQYSQLSAWTIVGLFVVWLGVMFIYTGVLTAALPGLKRLQALVVNFAGSAVSNVVPFGGAAGVGATYAMQMSWGFDAASITLAILVTGVWNVFTKLALPLLALAALLLAGEATGGLVVPTVIGLAVLATGVVLFTLVLRSETLAESLGGFAERVATRALRLIGRPPAPVRDVVLDFRHRSLGLLRTSWKRLTVWMLVYNTGQFVLLLLCVRALGTTTDELGWVEVFAAFAFANLLTTIAVTPSGVGFVEAGAVAALIAFGGPEAGSAAAVFLFRGLTYLMEIPLGALGWVVWASHTGWREPIARPNAA